MTAIVEVKAPSLAMNEAELINVLQCSLYPGAALESIKMVLSYCRASGLDPMQKPVHIVPMWDSKAGANRDVIMPGVNLYRTQAARSGAFAGMSEPEFGPDITKKIGGIDTTFPEWCRVTVKRVLSGGIIAEFTAREYWIENYAIKGGKEKSPVPNAMWTKRPRGQIAKCATAQALRIAFPEIASQLTAEEMEGKPMMDMSLADEAVSELGTIWIASAKAANDEVALTKVWTEGLKAFKAANDLPAYNAFKSAVEMRGKEIKNKPVDDNVVDVDFVNAMEAEEDK